MSDWNKAIQKMLGTDKLESLTDEQVDNLIEYLQGTCKSLDDGIYTLFESDNINIISMEQYHQIDNVIFLCVCCGWWYETGDYGEDINGELACNNCSPMEE